MNFKKYLIIFSILGSLALYFMISFSLIPEEQIQERIKEDAMTYYLTRVIGFVVISILFSALSFFLTLLSYYIIEDGKLENKLKYVLYQSIIFIAVSLILIFIN